EGRAGTGRIAITTRSGNLDQPQKNWSAWSAPIVSAKGDRIVSPAARFVQWKATLTGGGSSASPELESVDVAYLPKNIEPRVDRVEITTPNYKFPAPSAPPAAAPTITLPPMGRRSQSSSLSLDPGSSSSVLSYAKGMMGVRWSASDPNGDNLIYKVQIRGVNE